MPLGSQPTADPAPSARPAVAPPAAIAVLVAAGRHRARRFRCPPGARWPAACRRLAFPRWSCAAAIRAATGPATTATATVSTCRTSYWRMDAGDECTNYVAYVEATYFRAPAPGYLLGNAYQWAAAAAAHGVWSTTCRAWEQSRSGAAAPTESGLMATSPSSSESARAIATSWSPSSIWQACRTATSGRRLTPGSRPGPGSPGRVTSFISRSGSTRWSLRSAAGRIAAGTGPSAATAARFAVTGLSAATAARFAGTGPNDIAGGPCAATAAPPQAPASAAPPPGRAPPPAGDPPPPPRRPRAPPQAPMTRTVTQRFCNICVSDVAQSPACRAENRARASVPRHRDCTRNIANAVCRLSDLGRSEEIAMSHECAGREGVSPGRAIRRLSRLLSATLPIPALVIGIAASPAFANSPYTALVPSASCALATRPAQASGIQATTTPAGAAGRTGA